MVLTAYSKPLVSLRPKAEYQPTQIPAKIRGAVFACESILHKPMKLRESTPKSVYPQSRKLLYTSQGCPFFLDKYWA